MIFMGVNSQKSALSADLALATCNYNFDRGKFSEIGRITISTFEQRICMDAGEVMGGGGSASDAERDHLQPHSRLPDGFAVSEDDR